MTEAGKKARAALKELGKKWGLVILNQSLIEMKLFAKDN